MWRKERRYLVVYAWSGPNGNGHGNVCLSFPGTVSIRSAEAHILKNSPDISQIVITNLQELKKYEIIGADLEKPTEWKLQPKPKRKFKVKK